MMPLKGRGENVKKLEQLLVLLEMLVGDGTCVRCINKEKFEPEQIESDNDKTSLPAATNDENDDNENEQRK